MFDQGDCSDFTGHQTLAMVELYTRSADPGALGGRRDPSLTNFRQKQKSSQNRLGIKRLWI